MHAYILYIYTYIHTNRLIEEMRKREIDKLKNNIDRWIGRMSEEMEIRRQDRQTERNRQLEIV